MSLPRCLAHVLVGLVALAVVVPPAGATHDGVHPTVRTEQVYFHCTGGDTDKVQNAAAVSGQFPGWDTTAPTTSVRAGGGCATVDNNVGGTPYDGIWQGTSTGNLGSLTAELYVIEPGQAQAQGRYGLPLELTVDGVTVVDARIDFPVAATDAAVPRKLVFSVTDLPYLLEDGDGTTVRRVELRVANFTQGTWVFDAAEVPAGITFNPGSPEDARVSAGG